MRAEKRCVSLAKPGVLKDSDRLARRRNNSCAVARRKAWLSLRCNVLPVNGTAFRLSRFGARNRRNRFVPSCGLGIDQFHLIPVIREFVAAIQAHDIRTGDRSCRASAQLATDCNGEATAFVRTAEELIEHAHKVLPPGVGTHFERLVSLAEDKATPLAKPGWLLFRFRVL